MTEEMSCDVLVVGAGPAGSVAARAAASEGARVFLLECNRELGLPRKCAGYVSKAIRWHIDLPDECIAQSVDGIRTLLPDGSAHTIETPGYTLKRDLLDKHLALQAVEAGAHLLLGATAISGEGDDVLAIRDGREISVRARVIIGADGPTSRVAEKMGIQRSPVAWAFAYEVYLVCPLATAEVYFRPEFRGGYAWLFPAGRVARVGVACTAGKTVAVSRFRDLFRELEEAGKVKGPLPSFSVKPVPVGGLTTLRRGKTLLVGDAAGLAHPITGAGVVNAIISGEMAGRAAARAVMTGCLDYLEEYEEECRLTLGPGLERAARKRSDLERGWDSSPVELSRTIRRSWIAFDEYYRA